MNAYFPLLISYGIAIATNAALLALLWRLMRKFDRRISQLTTMTQRQEREITQQRYALAMLHQLQQGNIADLESNEKSDEALLNAAVMHLDEAAKEVEKTAQSASDVAIGTLKESEILQFIKKAIKNNEVAVSMQGIVKLPSREVRYYEVFARIFVGDQGYIPAGQFIGIARSHNLMGVVDNLLLLRCLQMIKQSAQKQSNAGYFVNISVQTLGNKAYIRDLVEFLEANPRLSSRLIFEMTQQDSLKISSTAKSVMEALSLLGCRFSMDQVTMFGMDLDRLVDNNISFVKLDAKTLEKEASDMVAKRRLKKLKSMLDSHGVEVIIEKVEHERQLLNLIDLYINFGQGYFFGQPELLV